MDDLTQVPGEPAASRSGGTAPAVPPECPLAMPRQALNARFRDPQAPEVRSDRVAAAVRAGLFLIVLGLTFWFAREMFDILGKGGLSILEIVMGLAFALSFVWIALTAVNAAVGAAVTLFPGRRPRQRGARSPLRVALLLPTYNEQPGTVFGNALAMLDAVEHENSGHRFSLFVLSDTTSPEIARAEETAFAAARARLGDAARLFYRRRPRNDERKAGNIAEWCRRWGGAYDALVVLDADSLMSGRAIVGLADALGDDPAAGLVQSVPRLVNGTTLFARLQQFATAAYGPLLSAGLAVWSRGEANYWGHNAIIRTRAFATCAGLPQLAGRKPFGGSVLSHDFVEAALLRRAGWRVRMRYSLDGSYEECPPALIDHVIRDSRWCQGNLQHLGVVGAAGLHPVSRFHLFQGVMAYVSSLLWLLFLVAGTAVAVQAGGMPVDYFPDPHVLFPIWPILDSERALSLLLLTLGVLLAPKLFGLLVILARARRLRAWGGAFVFLTSAAAEIILSAALAPILMVQQTLAIGRILIGRDTGWKPQRRTAARHGLWALLRFHWLETVIGLSVLWAIGVGLAPVWLAPVALSLSLAVPLSAVTALPLDASRLTASAFATPELVEPPEVVEAAKRHAEAVLDALPAAPQPTGNKAVDLS